MRALFITSKEKGHVHPVVGVAQELAARGHHVGWFFVPSPPPAADSLGVETVEFTISIGGGAVTEGAELAALLRDPLRLRGWIRALLLDGAEPLIAPLREVIRTFDPDVVLPDPMLYAAILAAHLEGRSWTALSSSLNPVTPHDFDCELARTAASLSAEREALFAKYDLQVRFSICDALSPWLTVVFTSPWYASLLGALPPDVIAVGPSRPRGSRGHEGARVAMSDRPTVFASFGSQAFHQPRRFEKLTAATETLGVRLVLAAGDLASSLRAPHVEAHALVDQLALLRRAPVFVTHGGANSVMEALDAGAPMLVAPIANDQPIQAAFVEKAGAGRTIDLERASVEQVREALAALLDGDASERKIARAIAREHAALDGASAAADRIAALGERA